MLDNYVRKCVAKIALQFLALNETAWFNNGLVKWELRFFLVNTFAFISLYGNAFAPMA